MSTQGACVPKWSNPPICEGGFTHAVVAFDVAVFNKNSK